MMNLKYTAVTVTFEDFDTEFEEKYAQNLSIEDNICFFLF